MEDDGEIAFSETDEPGTDPDTATVHEDAPVDGIGRTRQPLY
ncbi:hypothetical protein ACFQGE_12760 [Halomicroarcula sp. GCM10025817]|nr:hypothetical protein [Halomicroarcula sp. SYNS111]